MERVTRLIRTALPDIDVRVTETSTACVHISAKRGEGEIVHNALVVDRRNDAVAEALVLAGFRLIPRAPGRGVYVAVTTGLEEIGPADDWYTRVPIESIGEMSCRDRRHEGASRPWIALIPGSDPLESVHACYACTRRQAETL